VLFRSPPERTGIEDYGDVGSLRDEIGFEEDFPLDFSEIGDSPGSGDVDVPF
jgi:single-strand DNA-binding protein